MSHITRHIRARSLTRAAMGIAFIGLLIVGLWIANILWPSTPPRSYPTRVHTDPVAVAKGKVAKVVDGDTLILKDGNIVRLNGIDTPELKQKGYQEAREELSALVLGREVELFYERNDPADRYGRLLAFLEVAPDIPINEKLIQSGWAWIYRLSRHSKRWESYLTAQRNAMNARRGVWAVFKDREGPFYGSRASFVFHKGNCIHRHKISEKNQEVFSSLREAFWKGYSPCRNCFKFP